ncbi:MAG TPA: peptide transporter [Candidatus Hydrogenedentes bacterium]|nr:peptide transporter [Candidatus Hydrogenedentota bacterium]HOS02192.1 peptide transporter [Candidatus Hydrogenedentota bacterium]
MSEKPHRRSETEETQFARDFAVAFADPSLEQGPYVDGFSRRTVIGAIFVALVMMPGSVYLGLVAGQSLGPAAEWVTIILFAELSRRSFAHLRRQEVYVLFYVASSIAAVQLVNLALAGGPVAGSIWNQYLLQSPQTASIAASIPDWVAPPADSHAILGRDLLDRQWWWSASRGVLAPMGIMLISYFLGRFTWFGLGYIMFRITSDGERLPFPLAAIAAQGATALAESTDREEGVAAGRRSWRWNVFSVGATFGIVFGALYVLIPVATGLVMSKPIMLLPIPFIDFTSSVERVLPGSLISISFDAVVFMTGMILPFRLILGIVTAILLTSVFGNPILLHLGVFKHWSPGRSLLVNQMVLSFDFWMSVTIGLAASVAGVGLFSMGRMFLVRMRSSSALRAAPESGDAGERSADASLLRRPSRERGDMPLWVAVALAIIGLGGFCAISLMLVPGFPWIIIVLFGFLWTPLNSYISARLIGLTGQPLTVPFLRETAFITSGYRGIDIWFAPIPLFDMGPVAQRFRELELTRTKFTSLIKAELLMTPIVIVCSFFFWWFFWKLNQIPSDQFPFAARLWPVAARQACLIFTANSSSDSLLLQAISPAVIAGAGAIGVAIYSCMAYWNMPLIFFYGLVAGVGQPLHAGIPLLLGALASRYYFSRKFGAERWNRYIPVAAAGFACGVGLSGMIAVALALIAQCTRTLPF